MKKKPKRKPTTPMDRLTAALRAQTRSFDAYNRVGQKRDKQIQEWITGMLDHVRRFANEAHDLHTFVIDQGLSKEFELWMAIHAKTPGLLQQSHSIGSTEGAS